MHFRGLFEKKKIKQQNKTNKQQTKPTTIKQHGKIKSVHQTKKTYPEQLNFTYLADRVFLNCS